MNYRCSNVFLSSYTAEAHVCSEKIHEWRKIGNQEAIIDLRKSCFEIGVDEELWPYQVVSLKNKMYYLTRLGFDLCVADKSNYIKF